MMVSEAYVELNEMQNRRALLVKKVLEEDFLLEVKDNKIIGVVEDIDEAMEEFDFIRDAWEENGIGYYHA